MAREPDDDRLALGLQRLLFGALDVGGELAGVLALDGVDRRVGLTGRATPPSPSPPAAVVVAPPAAVVVAPPAAVVVAPPAVVVAPAAVVVAPLDESSSSPQAAATKARAPTSTRGLSARDRFLNVVLPVSLAGRARHRVPPRSRRRPWRRNAQPKSPAASRRHRPGGLQHFCRTTPGKRANRRFAEPFSVSPRRLARSSEGRARGSWMRRSPAVSGRRRTPSAPTRPRSAPSDPPRRRP